jgi:hypothetical protein
VRRQFGRSAEFFAVQVGLGYQHLAARGLELQGCANDIVSFASFFRERGVVFGSHVVCSDEAVEIDCTRILGGTLADIVCALKMTKDAMDRSVAKEKYLFYNFSGHGTQMSVLMGQRMARIITGAREADENPFHGIDWPAIPGHWGPPWFLPFVGAYYRYQDWRH